MVSQSVGRRMVKLQKRLLDIRLGTGALVLPKTIKGVHLRFAPGIQGGHQGPRKFWRNELVRLKYHNPAVPMTVDNKAPQTDRATMSIHFAAENAIQSSNSATSSPAAVDSTTTGSTPTDAASTVRVETINMTNYTNSEILDAFVKLTRAAPAEPTSQDLKEVADLKEETARSGREKALSLQVRMRQKREKELLEQAKGQL